MAEANETAKVDAARGQLKDLLDELCRRHGKSEQAIRHTKGSRINHENALNHILSFLRRVSDDRIGGALRAANSRNGTVFTPAYAWGRLFSHCHRVAKLLVSSAPLEGGTFASLLDTEAYTTSLLACMHPPSGDVAWTCKDELLAFALGVEAWFCSKLLTTANQAPDGWPTKSAKPAQPQHALAADLSDVYALARGAYAEAVDDEERARTTLFRLRVRAPNGIMFVETDETSVLERDRVLYAHVYHHAEGVLSSLERRKVRKRSLQQPMATVAALPPQEAALAAQVMTAPSKVTKAKVAKVAATATPRGAAAPSAAAAAEPTRHAVYANLSLAPAEGALVSMRKELRDRLRAANASSVASEKMQTGGVAVKRTDGTFPAPVPVVLNCTQNLAVPGNPVGPDAHRSLHQLFMAVRTACNHLLLSYAPTQGLKRIGEGQEVSVFEATPSPARDELNALVALAGYPRTDAVVRITRIDVPKRANLDVNVASTLAHYAHASASGVGPRAYGFYVVPMASLFDRELIDAHPDPERREKERIVTASVKAGTFAVMTVVQKLDASLGDKHDSNAMAPVWKLLTTMAQCGIVNFDAHAANIRFDAQNAYLSDLDPRYTVVFESTRFGRDGWRPLFLLNALFVLLNLTLLPGRGQNVKSAMLACRVETVPEVVSQVPTTRAMQLGSMVVEALRAFRTAGDAANGTAQALLAIPWRGGWMNTGAAPDLERVLLRAKNQEEFDGAIRAGGMAGSDAPGGASGADGLIDDFALAQWAAAFLLSTTAVVQPSLRVAGAFKQRLEAVEGMLADASRLKKATEEPFKKKAGDPLSSAELSRLFQGNSDAMLALRTTSDTLDSVFANTLRVPLRTALRPRSTPVHLLELLKMIVFHVDTSPETAAQTVTARMPSGDANVPERDLAVLLGIAR